MSVVVNPRADTRVEKPDPRVCAGAPCGWSAARVLEIGSVWPKSEEGRGQERTVARAVTHALARPVSLPSAGILRITASAIDDDSEATCAPQYTLLLQSRVVALRLHSDPSIYSNFWAANYHKQQCIYSTIRTLSGPLILMQRVVTCHFIPYYHHCQPAMRCFIFMLLAVASWNWRSVTLATPAPAPLQSPLLLSPLIRAGISEDIYSELLLFAKYSSAVYQFICPCPLGNTLVASVRRLVIRAFPFFGSADAACAQFSNVLTHAHGLVARDDSRREVVVAFRGSYELADMLTGTLHTPCNDRSSIYWFIHSRRKPHARPACVSRRRRQRG